MIRISGSAQSHHPLATPAGNPAQGAAATPVAPSATGRQAGMHPATGLPGNGSGTSAPAQRSRTGLFGRFRSDSGPASVEQIFKATLRDWSKEGPAHEKSSRARVAAQIKDAYKRNTDSLYIDNNKISTLPDCLDQLLNLRTLSVMASSLHALPALPPRLTDLVVKFTHVDTLPGPLPAGLVYMELSHNVLTSLPELPDGLMRLDVSHNRLTTLPRLPASLFVLNAESNRMRRLPDDLVEGLKEVNLNHNRLSHLPRLPHSITHLELSNNQLTRIDQLPNRLIRLIARGNQLGRLPEQMPPRICTLSIEQNGITELPPLPASLTQLHARGNPLSSLPALPADLNWLAVDRCALAAFPADLAAKLAEYDTMRPAIAELRRLQAQPAVRFRCLQDIFDQPPERWVRHFHPSPMPDQVPVVAPRPAPIERTQVLPRGQTQNVVSLPVEENDPRHTQALQQIDRYFRPSPSSDQAEAIRPRPLSTERTDPAPQIFTQDGTALPLETNELAQALALQRLYDMRDESPPRAARAAAPTAGRPVVAAPGPSTARRNSRNWSFPAEGDTAAAAFNDFQSRMSQTADYRDTRLRPGLVARLDTVVAAMDASPTLRQICFNIAQESTASCGDGVALALNDMELARVNHLAETGSMSVESLFALGEGLFKLHAVNEVALAKINTLKRDGIPIDEVEIRLAYQTELRQSLQLPGVAGAMLFRGAAYVTPIEISAAGQQVRRQLDGNASVQYLAQWKPWQQAMQRRHPDAYASLKAMHQDARDAIAIKPPRMTDQEWREEFVQLAADEASQLQRLTMRMTWDFIESMEQSGPGGSV